jgi:hypothetical protein
MPGAREVTFEENLTSLKKDWQVYSAVEDAPLSLRSLKRSDLISLHKQINLVALRAQKLMVDILEKNETIDDEQTLAANDIILDEADALRSDGLDISRAIKEITCEPA